MGSYAERSVEAGIRNLTWERKRSRDKKLWDGNPGQRAWGRSEQALGKRSEY